MQINISEFSIADYEQVLALWKRCNGIGLSDADSKANLSAYRNSKMPPVYIERQRQRYSILEKNRLVRFKIMKASCLPIWI